MTYWIAALLGFVSGMTEFFPVSRTGHLAFLQNYIGIGDLEEHLLFSFLIRLALLAAIAVTYLADLRELFRQTCRAPGKQGAARAQKQQAAKTRLLSFVALGFAFYLPALVLEQKLLSLAAKPMLVALLLVVTGAMLLLSDRLSHGNKNVRSQTLSDAASVALAQLVSALPGCSRSGLTISAGLLRGFDQSYAVRYSMLLWLPAGAASCLITLVRAVSAGIEWSYVPMYLVGMLVTFVFGSLAIYAVRLIAQRGRFGNFAFYCWGAGLLTLILFLIS